MAETGPIEMPVRSRNFNRSVSTRILHAIRNAPFDPMEQSHRSREVRVDTFARTVHSCRQLGSSKRKDRSCRASRETFKASPLNIGIYSTRKKALIGYYLNEYMHVFIQLTISEGCKVDCDRFRKARVDDVLNPSFRSSPASLAKPPFFAE